MPISVGDILKVANDILSALRAARLVPSEWVAGANIHPLDPDTGAPLASTGQISYQTLQHWYAAGASPVALYAHLGLENCIQ